MASESILLIGLMPNDIALIRRMLSSFDIDIEIADISRIEDPAYFDQKKSVCLVILGISENPQAAEENIGQLRHLLPVPVPIMLLLTWDMTFGIKEFIEAGADDYWVLPLDQSSFAIQFYVMLEWGQAIVRSGLEKNHVSQPRKVSFWNRISDQVGKGLHYFSPRTLLGTKDNAPIFRKWEKTQALGFGHCAEIWLIRKIGKDELAVAKIPYSARLNIQFLRAAAILKRMEAHPNAVHLVEVVEEERKVILIEEFVPGLTLQKRLNEGTDAAFREKVFSQLLDVMSFAHRLKIIHLDIKPDNMIITPEGNLKLLDFGVARDLALYDIGNQGYGSRQYMSPEQFVGKSGIVCDVWALGVMLFVLATGCFPFYDDPETNYLETIRECSPFSPCRIIPDLPEKLDGIIRKCLEKDVNERFPNADELRVEMMLTFPEFGKGKVFTELC